MPSHYVKRHMESLKAIILYNVAPFECTNAKPKTRCIMVFEKVNIIHKAMVPPGGGPVHCGPLRRRANIGPAGPAAQNNTPPPERTTSFLLPAGEERRRGGGGDPFTETGHQNVGLCVH